MLQGNRFEFPVLRALAQDLHEQMLHRRDMVGELLVGLRSQTGAEFSGGRVLVFDDGFQLEADESGQPLDRGSVLGSSSAQRCTKLAVTRSVNAKSSAGLSGK